MQTVAAAGFRPQTGGGRWPRRVYDREPEVEGGDDRFTTMNECRWQKRCRLGRRKNN
uniref:Uncharacterized protein n=1 Tax=Medicago truncatula TaxID=3880 RepID=Q2HRZ0_MEDTR|nr:hypothetical protein MtrDRAFT_AC157777g17v2 [Medicago truncatula]